jgi:hypothetical protein
MTKPVGGRGLKAPYNTTHVRIPVDIKPQVEVLVSDYRDKVLGIVQDNPLTTSDDKVLIVSDDKVLTLEQALELAQKIVNNKQSARKSMSLLLSAIYTSEVKL